MANPQQHSYRPAVGRAVTRKWAEARQVNYGGDDWGDDDDDGYGPNPYQQPLSQGNRSFTNPIVNTAQRTSFDRGQEQRNFSAGAVPPTHDFPQASNVPASRFYAQQPYEQPMARTSVESARRPDSRGSNVSARFPPRKQSLGQQELPDYSRGQAQQESSQPAPSAEPPMKPLPFIRPADIYKRMEEEKEKERQSQESSRPSMDSIQRATSNTSNTAPVESTTFKRTQPALDTVAERKSEYLDNLVQPTSSASQPLSSRGQHSNEMSRIDTNVLQAPSLASGSSRYTDRPDPVSASTMDSRFPSRNTSQHEPPEPTVRLPLINRASSFGTSFGNDFFSTTNPTTVRHPEPSRNTATPSETTELGADLQHRPSHGYRTLVNDAFTSQNQNASPAITEASLIRSNTTSTSQISPIMPESSDQHFGQALAQNAARVNDQSGSIDRSERPDDFQPPRRLGTNRRDSASPARKPLSAEAPPIPEPQSAITSPGEDSGKNQVRAAQFTRPGPAILVHSKPISRENLKDDQHLGRSESSISALSDNQRTASEEWESWAAAQREAHARHGIQDSNPATPGHDSSQMSSPILASSETPRATTNFSEESTKPSLGNTNLSAPRPLMQRDESFRPQLPGGWMSSTSIQQARSSAPEEPVSQSRPILTPSARNDSQASIPTARAPQDQNWKSQYNSGIQAQAFAAAASAGSALAGIFNGPSLTGRGTDTNSEVSSINEEGPTGSYRDPDMRSRDFAATPEPHVPQQSDTSATRDFAGMNETTPKAHQTGFRQEGGSLDLDTRHPLARPHPDSVRTDSPSKESERWWSEDEDDSRPTPAPAPLRTNRQSTIDPHRQPTSPVFNRSEVEDGADVNQLESDIVKSLTPKSSSVAPREVEADAGRSSPLRRESRPDHSHTVSPPFAAAALAVSPGNNYNAVQDQNAFRPLSAPSSKAQSPTQTQMPALPMEQSTSAPRHENSKEEPSLSQKVQETAKGLATSLAGVAASVAVAGGASYIAHDQPSSDDRSPMASKHAASSSAGAPELVPHKDRPAFSTARADSVDDERNRDQGSKFSRGSEPSPAVELPLTPTAQDVLPPKSTVMSSGLPSERAPMTPQKDLSRPIAPTMAASQRPISGETRSSGTPPPITPQTPAYSTSESTRGFPGDKVPFSQITNLGTSEARTRAYKDNRDAYIQPVGQLENWLSHMNQSGHDVFAVRPIAHTLYSTPNSAQRHTRESSGPPSGSRQMREDGQKLFASASKYGQKAGVLGKGLFAKGKEKLRTASAGQKVSPSRRDSSSNTSTVQVDKYSPAPVERAPQIPTPVMATPLDEDSMTAYFLKKEDAATNRGSAPLNTTQHEAAGKAAREPLFSPISEVSTNPANANLDRTNSAVSNQQEQSPQSSDTVKAHPSLPATAVQPPTPMRKDTVKSSGGVSAMGPDDERTAGDLLASSQPAHIRKDSSVSDVSSVSDNEPNANLSRLRTAGVSPELQPRTIRDEVRPPVPNQQNTPLPLQAVNTQEQKPHHAPSYSTTMATAPVLDTASSKEAEARADRQEESSLPRYSQIPAINPRMTPGAQIVPIARIRQDEQPFKAEQNRPFSFAGSESILNAGYPTNRSIDHATSSTVHSPSSAERNLLAQTVGQVQAQRDQHGGSPLPSARRNPEEFAGRSPEEFARLRQQQPAVQTQSQEEEAYRIPGPYGQELRSPKQRTSSPLLEQLRQTPLEEQRPYAYEESSHGSAMPTVNALAAAEQYQQQHEHPTQRDSAGLGNEQYQHPHAQQAQMAANIAEPNRAQETGRPSKFSSLFRPRSKSRSRLQKEENRSRHQQERPETGRRPSLLKFGSRGSGGRDSPVPQRQNDEPQRPGASGRKLSKDLFRTSTFGPEAEMPNSYETQQVQPERLPVPKKKRFSGFFGGKSYNRNDHPQRASTLPSNTQQPQFPATLHTDTQQSQITSNLPSNAQRSQVMPTAHDLATVPHAHHENAANGHGQSMYDASQQCLQPDSIYREPGRQFQNTPLVEGYHGVGHNSAQAEAGYGDAQQRVSRDARVSGNEPYEHMPPRRPDLPRLNTGDDPHPLRQQPASAPVGNMYMQSPQAGMHDVPHQHYHQHQQRQQIDPVSHQGQESYAPPSTRANRDISYGSDFRQPTSPSQIHGQQLGPLPAQPHPHQFQVDRVAQIAAENRARQPQSNISDRVRQLHTRSRSPKLGRKSSDDLKAEFQGLQPPSATSPVSGLGTFNSKKVSPIGINRDEGEQEKPWAIALPEEEQNRNMENDPSSTTNPRSREMRRMMLERTPQQPQTMSPAESRPLTVAEKFMNHGNPAQQQPRSGVRSPSATTHSSVGTAHNTGGSITRAESPSVLLRRDPSRRGKAPISRTGTPDMPQSRPSMDVVSPSAGRSRDSSGAQYFEPSRTTSMHSTASSGPKAIPAPSSAPPLPPAPVGGPVLPAHNDAEMNKAIPMQATNTRPVDVFELSGSKPEGYESEEEPIMSANALPGQEWQPVFDSWED